jgi:segregation and condensation protein B
MGSEALPELRQIAGALLFGAGRPLTLKELRTCLVETAERYGEETKAFSEVTEADLEAAVSDLTRDLEAHKLGFHVQSHGGAYRFQSDAACGKWMKQLLAIGQMDRLSRPALETLAIIAYRQPITKAEIEKVRGVNVDHMIRMLMEMQLVRIAGRSDLPGRPFLFGTTQNFLEHFGLKDLKDLSDLEPMLRAGADEAKSAAAAARAAEPVVVPGADAAPPVAEGTPSPAGDAPPAAAGDGAETV